MSDKDTSSLRIIFSQIASSRNLYWVESIRIYLLVYLF